jgi:hypothetical protein
MEEGEILHSISKAINKLLIDDFGFVGACPANRFGEPVVIVQCVDKESKFRIENLLKENNLSTSAYYMSPIWGTGQLKTEYLDEINRKIRLPEYCTHGTKYFEEFRIFMDKVTREEQEKWNSMTQSEKSYFLKVYINDHWAHFKNYGESAKKFL